LSIKSSGVSLDLVVLKRTFSDSPKARIPARESSPESSSELSTRQEFPSVQTLAETGMATLQKVSGPTILLGSGNYYDYENPEESVLTIEDIAYGLGFTCRFRGQTVERSTGRRVFYSVADHCEIMSRIVPPELAFDALMHEIGETVVGDTPGPLKGICPDIRSIEKRCEAAGLRLFGATMSDKAEIKRFDLIMLATERRDLTPWRGEPWEWLDIGGIEPIDLRIRPRSPEDSAEAFLVRYHELASGQTR
jgi:hypothetical protein